MGRPVTTAYLKRLYQIVNNKRGPWSAQERSRVPFLPDIPDFVFFHGDERNHAAEAVDDDDAASQYPWKEHKEEEEKTSKENGGEEKVKTQKLYTTPTGRHGRENK